MPAPILRRLLLLPLLLAAARASARTWPDCLHSGPKKSAPATLADLRACQKKAARRLIDRAKDRGAPLSDADLDALGDYQRSEARRYLARTGAVVEAPAARVSQRAEPAAAAAPRTETASAGGGDGEAAPDAAPSEPNSVANMILRRYKAAGLDSVPDSDVEYYTEEVSKTDGVITSQLSAEIDARIKAAKADNPPPTLQKLPGNDGAR